MATRTAAPRSRTTRTTARDPAAQHGADQDHGDADTLQMAPAPAPGIETGGGSDEGGDTAEDEPATVDPSPPPAPTEAPEDSPAHRLAHRWLGREAAAAAHEQARDRLQAARRRKEETVKALDADIAQAVRELERTRCAVGECEGARDALLLSAPEELRDKLRAAQKTLNLAGGVVGRAQMAVDAADRTILALDAPIVNAERAVKMAEQDLVILKGKPAPKEPPARREHEQALRHAVSRVEQAKRALDQAINRRGVDAVNAANKALSDAAAELRKAKKQEDVDRATLEEIERECLRVVTGGLLGV